MSVGVKINTLLLDVQTLASLDFKLWPSQRDRQKVLAGIVSFAFLEIKL